MTPSKGNGPDAANDRPAKTLSKRNTDFTPDEKQLATIIAQLALAGHVVHRLETGYTVSRWGLSKFCPDFASLLGFARQVGVGHASN